MNKTCTTCKFEPDWIDIKYSNNFTGNCKKLPSFINAWFYRKTDQIVSCQTDGFDDPIPVTDCSLWEKKDAS